MQRRRRPNRRPVRRLATLVREVDRSMPDLEASVTEAYAPRGSEKVFLFKVRDRLKGQIVFSITAPTDRSPEAEAWLRTAKARAATP